MRLALTVLVSVVFGLFGGDNRPKDGDVKTYTTTAIPGSWETLFIQEFGTFTINRYDAKNQRLSLTFRRGTRSILLPGVAVKGESLACGPRKPHELTPKTTCLLRAQWTDKKRSKIEQEYWLWVRWRPDKASTVIVEMHVKVKSVENNRR